MFNTEGSTKERVRNRRRVKKYLYVSNEHQKFDIVNDM
jgi:hypothetical protein